MIQIINVYPYIEKKVFGKQEDQEFHPVQTTYSLGGFDVINYLEKYKIDYQGYGLIGTNAQHMMNFNKKMKLFQIKQSSRTISLCIAEEEVIQKIEDDIPEIELSDIQIFEHIIASQLKIEDIVVLKEVDGILSIPQMEKVYQTIYAKRSLFICDFHPNYLSLLRHHPSAVLFVDMTLFVEIKIKTSSELIAYAKKHLASLANIVIVSMDSYRLFIFHEGQVYQGTYPMKDLEKQVYHDAILAGILLCEHNKGDMKELMTSCLEMSVGASLSSGLYVPSKEALSLIRKKIKQYNKGTNRDETKDI